MSYNSDLDSYRNSDGSTSRPGQENGGKHEAMNGLPLSQQQPWESNEAYMDRANSYEYHRK